VARTPRPTFVRSFGRSVFVGCAGATKLLRMRASAGGLGGVHQASTDGGGGGSGGCLNGDTQVRILCRCGGLCTRAALHPTRTGTDSGCWTYIMPDRQGRHRQAVRQAGRRVCMPRSAGACGDEYVSTSTAQSTPGLSPRVRVKPKPARQSASQTSSKRGCWCGGAAAGLPLAGPLGLRPEKKERKKERKKKGQSGVHRRTLRPLAAGSTVK